jgi:hypothetical protein
VFAEYKPAPVFVMLAVAYSRDEDSGEMDTLDPQ